MGAVTTVQQRGAPFTRAELDALPDDGRRHELIDGALVVTPAPRVSHQLVVGELHLLLRQACPAGLYVVLSPFDVALSDDTVLEPDLLVARKQNFTERDLPAAPLLAIEVVSPSTRRIDATLKRARLEAAGCPSYWLVDPGVPSVLALELVEGAYVEAAHVAGEQTWRATKPFPVAVRPSALTAPLR
ncbi:Uma2 family endonuclease [soil metagenome]